MNEVDSILNRYAGRGDTAEGSGPATEEEVIDDLGAFGWLRGSREKSVMLELRKKDGFIRAVGYAMLDPVDFDPSVGITLHMQREKILIKGRNLNSEHRPNLRLFQGLTRHRVPWIQEADEPAILLAEASATIIEEILW